MGCKASTYEELIALNTGELNRWRAWRLRRHLACCPDCHAAFMMTQTLWGAVSLASKETVEENARERLYISLFSIMRQPSREANALSEPRSLSLPRRMKRMTFATGLVTVLVLVTPVVATVVYVHHAQEEEQRLKIGADWQQRDLMTQQNYVKLRLMIDGIRESGTISDENLDWSLNIMKQSPSGIVHARVMGMLTLLKQITPAQKQKIQAAITPLLTSEDKLDRAYSERVQTVLDK